MEQTTLSSGSAEIITSGLVISFKRSPITIAFGSDPNRITLTFAFVDQAGEPSSFKSTTPAPNTLAFSLINFSNPVGTGTLEPVQIGTYHGKPMYLHFRTYAIGESDRTLQYTLYADASPTSVNNA